MGAYATRAELAVHGIGTKFLAGVSTPDQDAALVAASRAADMYLRSRYAVPIAAWQEDLTRLVCHIAAWDLYSTRRVAGDEDDGIERRSRAAVVMLRDVSEGKAHLAGITESASESWPQTIGAVSDESRGW